MKKTLFLALLVLLGIGYASAQTRVTGTVTGDDGKPISYLTVIVKGTTTTTTTDADGKYSITVPSQTSTLVFAFSGMKTQEVVVGSRSVVNAAMQPEAEQLETVVITAMGIQRSDRSVGYSVAKVDPAKATQKAEPDMLRALDGKIPGVQVNSSSAVAGSGTKVTIRGNTSFYGNNDPLYVVDGIPYSNPSVTTGSRLTGSGATGSGISTLDPNDIESMSVLKGAAAAALYGSRAAHGVILITTKSGSKKTRPSQKGFEVTLSTSYSIENVTSLPDYQNRYGQGSNFLYSNANGSWGPDFAEQADFPTYPSYLAAYPTMSATQKYQAYPNNVKDLFKTGGVLDLSANVMSYNDKGSFSTTVSRTQQDGYIPHSEFERTSFSAGGNQKLDNGLRVGGTVSYSRTIQDSPLFGAGSYAGSSSSFARTLLLPRNYDINGLPYKTATGANLFPLSGVDNPIWSWENNTVKTYGDRSVATVSVGYDITKWLSFDYQFGLNQYSMDRKQVVNIGSTGESGKGAITDDTDRLQELESNFLITFKHDLAKDLSLKAVVGHNINQQTRNRSRVKGTEMLFANIYNVSNTQTQYADPASNYYERGRLWALFADATLGYKNYAFLNLTIRNDHSSTLPSSNNSYWYPAAVGSFVFSDALKIEPKILNFGKFRISWGMVGNDASPYSQNGTFSPDTPFDSRPGMYTPTAIYDPNLKPEFTSEFEIGTDLQFFNNRIGLDFSWYSRLSTDQIAPISLPRSSGHSSYYTNFGKLSNKGVEIGLNLVPVKLKNSFTWNIYGTFSKNVSEVKELVAGIDRLTIGTGSTSEPQPTFQPGSPYGVLRGTKIARDNEGNPLVNPANGCYMLDSNYGVLGDPNPDYKATITNTFSYKGLTLSALFDWTVGGVIAAGSVVDMLGRGVTKDTEDRLGTRILPGVLADPNTQTPILDAGGNKIPNNVQINENTMYFASSSASPTFAQNGVHEFSTYDATVFRLREISLGYDLPKKWLKSTFIGSANFSIVARNLWHYAPGFPEHMNYDPGSNAFGIGNAQGIEREAAPTVRRIGFNLKLTF